MRAIETTQKSRSAWKRRKAQNGQAKNLHKKRTFTQIASHSRAINKSNSIQAKNEVKREVTQDVKPTDVLEQNGQVKILAKKHLLTIIVSNFVRE